MKTNQLLAEVKASGQDYEWYPTTTQIINAIKHDLEEVAHLDSPSILDCGAGDGRVLDALTEGSRYAIEKSEPLLNALSRDIYVVGTEFKEQTLIDKKVDVVFSNPPYLEFKDWTLKIIAEANATLVYLVIPERWQSDQMILDAIEARKSEATVILSTDFLDADRQARAKVSVVRIDMSDHLKYSDRRWGCRASSPNVDPFKKWFEDNFKIEIANSNDDRYSLGGTDKKKLDESLNNELVEGRDLITSLEKLYQRDLQRLTSNYQKLGDIDPVLLKELNVEMVNVLEALQLKIKGLKNLYWEELFDNLRKVTDKLTFGSRDSLLKRLTTHTQVDFSASNAYAVVIWVIKNANHYYDDQLIELVERMTEKANVLSYVSNAKTFGEEEWRYNRPTEDLVNYKLDYRIVLARIGGICTSEWSYERTDSGLERRAEVFIDDLRTVATNIGFDTTRYDGARNKEWTSGKKHNFSYYDHQSGNEEVLFEAKAFKNGNMHIKLNQKFIQKLNVEFGRLKGWIKSPKEAAEELDIPFEQAAESFNSNLKLESSNFLSLEFKEAV